MSLAWLTQPIKTIDSVPQQAAVSRQAQLTKPPGSLGALEDIAVRLASLQACDRPQVERVRIVVFAGDHGVVAEGVSAFPQSVTVEMLRNFARGGAAFGSDRQRPASKQHGAWTHIRGNQFAWTTTEDLFDPMGSFSGTLKVRVKVTITDKDEFVGVSNGEQRDANGNLTFNRCGTVRGTRIKVEPLAEQCQSITPPR